MREIELGHGRLTYVEAGGADALVLLHGIGSSARSWGAQIAVLSDAFRVLAWNAPGYAGSTGFADEAPGVDAYADVLRQFLDAAHVERCHLVGHSLGALIAARYAVRNPRRVRTLTLASCALGHARLPAAEREALLRARLDDVAKLGPEGMARTRAARLLGPSATPAHIESVRRNMAAIDPRGYAQAARMLSGGDLVADISALALATPLQIVYGTADVITPPAANLRAAAARAGARVRAIEGAGHALYVEADRAFNTVLRDFIGARHA